MSIASLIMVYGVPPIPKAANVLLKLARNLIDRASDGRLDQWTGR
jgi:hypothetical protein